MAEGFDHGNAADVLHGSVVHLFNGGLILLHHFLGALVAVEAELHPKGQHDAHHGRKAEAPVHGQEDRDHDHRRDKGRDHVRQLMRDKSLHLFDVLVHDLAQFAAADLDMESKRHAGQMRGEVDFQRIQRPEGRQVRKGQCAKVQKDVQHNAAKGQPAVSDHRPAIQAGKVRKAGQQALNDFVDGQVRRKAGNARQGRQSDSGHDLRLLGRGQLQQAGRSRLGLFR